MRRSADAPMRFAVWMLVSFVVGIVTGMLFLVGESNRERLRQSLPAPAQVDSEKPEATNAGDSAQPVSATQPADRPQADERAKTADVQSVRHPAPESLADPLDLDEVIDDLRDRKLTVPVQHVTREMLRDSFDEA